MRWLGLVPFRYCPFDGYPLVAAELATSVGIIPCVCCHECHQSFGPELVEA